mmetsp:Transcript_86999/g.243929  ORF Transcript_86999/g.243929 Transcript_86999/m.243929 type:complete len:221 (+) Transcript_86999:103-765(+)
MAELPRTLIRTVPANRGKFASRSRGGGPLAASGPKKDAELEEKLIICELRLKKLEEVSHQLDLQGEEAGGSHCEELQELGRRLGSIAASSLELACSRTVPGAMDTFERANAGVDRVAKLLGSDVVMASATSSRHAAPLLSMRRERATRRIKEVIVTLLDMCSAVVCGCIAGIAAGAAAPSQAPAVAKEDEADMVEDEAEDEAEEETQLDRRTRVTRVFTR